MAESDDSEEKTQEATPKRKQELREKGEVPRSRDLNRIIVLFVGAACLWLVSNNFYSAFQEVAVKTFDLTPQEMFDPSIMLTRFASCLYILGMSLLPFFAILFVIVIFSPALLGGWVFSAKSLAFKGERLDPIKGIGRIFSLRSLVELLKSIAKFIVIAGGGILVLYIYFHSMINLDKLPVEQGITQGMELLFQGFILISATLVIIVLFDVPYQIWEYLRKSKMSIKELKDESKETEGNPQLKQKIRETQQRMSEKRMMQALPKANVVITNPNHYAVALMYDQDKEGAPKVVAKGVDFLAEKIKEVAKEHKITIVSIPPLARAIYYSTDLDAEIPQGLYLAVAKVLAYVYQLKHYVAGFSAKPQAPKASELKIPQELQRE
ncbi:MAG: flagellar biosynthesis protein FlhB [Legionellales bacterium]|nr:flagellar biosynthesis protein FlhB [Legionellales bacterium]